jgi:hypothetical protein
VAVVRSRKKDDDVAETVHIFVRQSMKKDEEAKKILAVKRQQTEIRCFFHGMRSTLLLLLLVLCERVSAGCYSRNRSSQPFTYF